MGTAESRAECGMMKRIVLLASFALTCLVVRADVIQLNNGDRISGTVTGLDANGLHLRSSYAGDLKIKLAAVNEIHADQPLHVRTKTEVIETRTIQFSDGELRAETAHHAIVSVPPTAVVLFLSNQEFIERQRSPHGGILGMWSGSASAGFSAARGNAAATTLDVEAKAARVAAKDKFDVFFTSLFAHNTTSQRGTTGANSIRSGAAYSVNLTDRLFSFGFTNFETDALQICGMCWGEA